MDFNENAYKNLDYTKEEFRKLTIADFYVTRAKYNIKRHINKLLKEGNERFESKYKTKNGDIRDVIVTTRVLSLERRNIISTTWHDVTELNRSKKEAENSTRDLERTFNSISRSF